jgi:hypothetical protein
MPNSIRPSPHNAPLQLPVRRVLSALGRMACCRNCSAAVPHHGRTPSWKPSQDALQPHRRGFFAELYNSNENVRGFCTEFDGGPTAFPTLDEYALGTRQPTLAFQRASRQGPNWNVARELISQVQTVILLDDSGSMGARGHRAWGYGNNDSRWEQARTLITGIAPLVSLYTRHGIDVHFLNRPQSNLGPPHSRRRRPCLSWHWSFGRHSYWSPRQRDPRRIHVRAALQSLVEAYEPHRHHGRRGSGRIAPTLVY